MRKLNFDKNYNNKLDCDYHTSIRPASGAFLAAEKVEILLKKKPHHIAVIKQVRLFTFDKLSDFTTCLDAGVELATFSNMWRTWYPDFDFKNERVAMMLFKKVQEVKAASPTNEKIALFCRYFEQYNQVKYKISRAETGMIKTVEVTDDLLQRYFTCTEWWSKVKSVTNYVKNYNQIRVLEVGTGATGHPNQWDVSHAKKLNGPELSEYYKHLRSIGLVAKKNSQGTITDWVPKSKV